MPELPEVRTVAETLKKSLIGKKITNNENIYSNIVEKDSLNLNNIINKTIKDIITKGKYLIFKIEDLYLVSHLRMEGKYFIKDKTLPKEKHEHIIFYLNDNTTLRYHDSRKFGRMQFVKDLSNCPGLAKLGLEPFDKNITKEYLFNKINKKNLTIKELLLDQTIIAGLGNIYANEVLFISKINPSKKGKDLKLTDCEKIINASKEVLEEAIKLGGTTIKSYTSSLGVTGKYQDKLLVHKKENQNCQNCSAKIIKEKIGGRSTYYCPNCQNYNYQDIK